MWAGREQDSRYRFRFWRGETVSEVKAADGHGGLLLAAPVIMRRPVLTHCLISILITNISPRNKEII